MAGARKPGAALGLDVIENQTCFRNLLVSGTYSQLATLAALDEVSYIMPASVDLLTGAPVRGAGPHWPKPDLSRTTPWSAPGGPRTPPGWWLSSITSVPHRENGRGDRARGDRCGRCGNGRSTPPSASRRDRLPMRPGPLRSVSRGAPRRQLPVRRPGRILGHTYYPAPPNIEPVAGDMHLDADEPWAAGATMDLYSVVLHEAGHALGLGHSDVPGAVMYPYYRQATGLTADDVAGIQALYGSGGTPAADPGLRPCRLRIRPPRASRPPRRCRLRLRPRLPSRRYRLRPHPRRLRQRLPRLRAPLPRRPPTGRRRRWRSSRPPPRSSRPTRPPSPSAEPLPTM